MKLPGNIPSSVFKRQLLQHLDETMPKLITRCWNFRVDESPFDNSVIVYASYKKWSIATAIDPDREGLLSGGLITIEMSLKRHFWFLDDCADEEEMYAKLLLADKPEKVA